MIRDRIVPFFPCDSKLFQGFVNVVAIQRKHHRALKRLHNYCIISAEHYLNLGRSRTDLATYSPCKKCLDTIQMNVGSVNAMSTSSGITSLLSRFVSRLWRSHSSQFPQFVLDHMKHFHRWKIRMYYTS